MCYGEWLKLIQLFVKVSFLPEAHSPSPDGYSFSSGGSKFSSGGSKFSPDGYFFSPDGHFFHEETLYIRARITERQK